MSSLLDRIYAKSPIWFQNTGISAYGLIWRHRRFGGEFPRYVTQFADRERFSLEEWRDYQTRQLRALLLNAHQYVPYYTALFARLGLSKSDLEHFTLGDLPELPILEKEHIHSHPELFISKNIRTRHLNKYYTSGTTGTPLTIWRTADTDRKNQALYEIRVRRWAGVNQTMSRAMIGGRIVVPRANARPPFWRYNAVERQLYLSAFHISPPNVPDYVEALNRFRPDYMVGYASSQYFLARMIMTSGLAVHQPKAVLTSSEKLTDEMRETISRVYHCPVFDGYSGVEACCHLSECEHHTLHESPDMGIIELLDDSGQHAAADEYGEIIATGLLNFDQPLIRYRTGDLAIRVDGNHCACGRQMPIYRELVGRLEDTVVSADGREMVRFHGIFVGLLHVREGQIIQKTLTDFLVRLVVTEQFGDSDKAEIHHRFETRLGPVHVEFEFVNQIERTLRGKFRAVISHVERA
ncbi:MAG: phenylacetate--CoA ligase family protein [Anaerolineales bacterium]|nr:phenylacetate--CoA ligase family protein [Anaerolineales bacterium]